MQKLMYKGLLKNDTDTLEKVRQGMHTAVANPVGDGCTRAQNLQCSCPLAKAAEHVAWHPSCRPQRACWQVRALQSLLHQLAKHSQLHVCMHAQVGIKNGAKVLLIGSR